MVDLIQVAQKVQAFCEERDWPFCIIGGLALQFWGENRLTLNVDLTLLTGIGTETDYIEPLTSEFSNRIENAAEFALRNRVLLLESESVGIDISLGATEFEKSMIARAAYREYLPGVKLRICSAEDLIVMKSFAARPKDWIDVESILERQAELDWQYINSMIEPLAEIHYDVDILGELEKRRRTFYQK